MNVHNKTKFSKDVSNYLLDVIEHKPWGIISPYKEFIKCEWSNSWRPSAASDRVKSLYMLRALIGQAGYGFTQAIDVSPHGFPLGIFIPRVNLDDLKAIHKEHGSSIGWIYGHGDGRVEFLGVPEMLNGKFLQKNWIDEEETPASIGYYYEIDHDAVGTISATGHGSARMLKGRSSIKDFSNGLLTLENGIVNGYEAFRTFLKLESHP